MRRYWIESEGIQGDKALIEGDLFHHICVVCRQGCGDRFELLQGPQAYFVEIIDIHKKKAVAQIHSQREIPQPPAPRIHLALSLPKIATMEKVIEKSVELGVAGFHAFTSDFSSMKMTEKDWQAKSSRWERIILGATQQTGRGDLMNLTTIRPLSVLLKEYAEEPNARALLAFESEEKRSLHQEILSWPKEKPDSLWIFVGGEGGFSSQDISLFKDYGILPIGLGEQVLRVETACVTLLGILKYHLGHFG